MNDLKTDKLEYLSELYKTLSNLQEKVNDTNGYLESHKKVLSLLLSEMIENDGSLIRFETSSCSYTVKLTRRP